MFYVTRLLRASLIGAIAVSFCGATVAIAQTGTDSYSGLRRPGEKRPRVVNSDGSVETRTDQRTRTNTKRALGSRESTFDEQITSGPSPNRRLNTRVLGRINTRIDTRLSGLRAAGTEPDDPTLDTTRLPTPTDSVRR